MKRTSPVSICLTTYNRASVLPVTLDSLLTQDYADFELIISDDCSTDGTEDICRDYASRDSRILYRRNKSNVRMPDNLNKAIRETRGEYIAIAHDGDVYRPDLISAWKNALDRVPSAAFVFNAYESRERNGNWKIFRAPYPFLIPKNEIAKHFFRTLTSCVWGTVMMRRAPHEAVGPFNRKFGFVSDVDMWLKLSRDYDVVYIDEPLIKLHPREADHVYDSLVWLQTYHILAIYAEHLCYYRQALPEETRRLMKSYAWRRRAVFLRQALTYLKNSQRNTLSEGFSLWRDSNDIVLSFIGHLFGRAKRQPHWYRRDHWENTDFKYQKRDCS